MGEQYFGIPKLRNGGERERVISIDHRRMGTGYSATLDLTLKEAEDLAWRLKQGLHLLKYGKPLKQRL